MKKRQIPVLDAAACMDHGSPLRGERQKAL